MNGFRTWAKGLNNAHYQAILHSVLAEEVQLTTSLVIKSFMADKPILARNQDVKSTPKVGADVREIDLVAAEIALIMQHGIDILEVIQVKLQQTFEKTLLRLLQDLTAEYLLLEELYLRESVRIVRECYIIDSSIVA